MKWIEAVKIWNSSHNKGTWCMPRRGSPEHAAVKKIQGVTKHHLDEDVAPPKPKTISKEEAHRQIRANKAKPKTISKEEAHKQIRANKAAFQEKVETLTKKSKQSRALRTLKALVAARRARKAQREESLKAAAKPKGISKEEAHKQIRANKAAAAAAAVTPTAIYTSLWEGEPSEKNSIRFKSAASNADIIKAIHDHDASYQSLAFTVSTSSNGSKLITPQGSSYQQEQGFKTKFNRKAWVAYNDADGDKYSAAEIDRFKPAPAPLAPPKTKEELFHIIGAYIKNLTPDDYMTNSSFRDARRNYSIHREVMPENVKKAFDAVRGLKVVYQTLGEKGANYLIQPTSNELEITVETQDNWAREYVYRDAFQSIGMTLSDNNEHLPKQIKEIYKGAYKPESEKASVSAPAPAPAPVKERKLFYGFDGYLTDKQAIARGFDPENRGKGRNVYGAIPPKNRNMAEELTSIRSLGQWSWRRFGGNEIKGEEYNSYKDSTGKYFTTFKIKEVKQQYSGYWAEWGAIIGKTVVWKTTGLRSDDDSLFESEVEVLSNGNINVKIPGKGPRDEADLWLERYFGSTLMDLPEEAYIEDKTPTAAAPAPPPPAKQLIEPAKQTLLDSQIDPQAIDKELDAGRSVILSTVQCRMYLEASGVERQNIDGLMRGIHTNMVKIGVDPKDGQTEIVDVGEAMKKK